MHPRTKPVASLSLDLDDKWTYMKTHGDPGWRTYPSYLHIVVPRVLKFLRERDLTITFFVVGQDAAMERNQKVLRSLADAGHEIANHSFRHEPWLHLYSREELLSEMENADRAITAATGQKPTGFRGPGFSVSQDVIEVLVESGYRYDASTLPTFLGPLARAYYFLSTSLRPAEREQRSLLFGSLKDGLRPLQPYSWKAAHGTLLELPVTTMPIFRTPFHLSYLDYLSGYSRPLRNLYLSVALALCRLRGVRPSFLLHPLDFLELSEAPELSFFPAMNLNLAHKLEAASSAIAALRNHFDVRSMEAHVNDILPLRAEAVSAVLRDEGVSL